MITYQEEKLTDIIDEMYPLLQEHFLEVDEGVVGEITYPIAFDWDSYQGMLNAGALRIYTARSEGVLIGYVWYCVIPALHMMGCITAYDDLHYVKPSHRKGWTAIKMFKFAEASLKLLKVNRIITGTKIGKDKEVLFKRLGYEVTEKLFVKGL